MKFQVRLKYLWGPRFKMLISRFIIAVRIVLLHRHGKYFDREWYLNHYYDVMSAGKDPLIHFAWKGIYEGRQPNDRFSSAFYLMCNPDIASYHKSPQIHFMLHGHRENRSWYKKKLNRLPQARLLLKERSFSEWSTGENLSWRLGNLVIRYSRKAGI